ncbi:hypothetical protein D9M68_545690 [compost metagenome]
MHRVQQIGAGQVAMDLFAPLRQYPGLLQHRRRPARRMGDDERRIDGHHGEQRLQQARGEIRLADRFDQAGLLPQPMAEVEGAGGQGERPLIGDGGRHFPC